MKRNFLENGIEIISVAEPMRANDPTGKLFRQIIGAFAEFKKAMITESMAGGRLCIGYISDKQNKALAVNEYKVSTIKRVFDLRESGMSFEKTALILNQEGYTTALNKSFSKMQVKRIIDRREFYSGIYKYANVCSDEKHKAIL